MDPAGGAGDLFNVLFLNSTTAVFNDDAMNAFLTLTPSESGTGGAKHHKWEHHSAPTPLPLPCSHLRHWALTQVGPTQTRQAAALGIRAQPSTITSLGTGACPPSHHFRPILVIESSFCLLHHLPDVSRSQTLLQSEPVMFLCQAHLQFLPRVFCILCGRPCPCDLSGGRGRPAGGCGLGSRKTAGCLVVTAAWLSL